MFVRQRAARREHQGTGGKLYAEALYDRVQIMMQEPIEVAENLLRPQRSSLQLAQEPT